MAPGENPHRDCKRPDPWPEPPANFQNLAHLEAAIQAWEELFVRPPLLRPPGLKWNQALWARQSTPSLCGRIHENIPKAHSSKSAHKNSLIYILVGNLLLVIKRQIQDSEVGWTVQPLEIITEQDTQFLEELKTTILALLISSACNKCSSRRNSKPTHPSYRYESLHFLLMSGDWKENCPTLQNEDKLK